MPGISISQRVRRARISSGLTQATLAEKVKVSQATVALWEGSKTPNAEQLSKLEKVLGPIRNQKKTVVAKAKKSQPKAEEEEYVSENPVSAVGTWVRETRTRSGLTPAELAAKAGVSYQTIIFLENGRIQNPQRRTLEKLEKTLKAKIPKEVSSEVATESAIGPDIGNLTDFDPNDRESWPQGPGIYVLYDVSQRPIYVGKSNSISKRLAEHYDKFWFRPPIVENASYVEASDDSLRSKLELVLIKFLKSNAVINKQSVESFD